MSSLLIVTDETGALRAVEFANREERMYQLLRDHYGDQNLHKGRTPAAIAQAFDAYFEGDIEALNSLEVATGGTSFQREVWKALRAIPAGATTSYGKLAASLGAAKASRAVGAANGANPIAIVVPCHRVIGANGTLTGYAGGLERKKWLLEHEARFATVAAEPRLL